MVINSMGGGELKQSEMGREWQGKQGVVIFLLNGQERLSKKVNWQRHEMHKWADQLSW